MAAVAEQELVGGRGGRGMRVDGRTTLLGGPTLKAGLAGADNALNFLRLCLASSVIVGHSWGLSGWGAHPLAGLGGWAVQGFFIISGYLIAGSRLRLRLVPFFWRRTLRIMPAFWACLLITGFVLAPLSTLLSGETYQLGDGWQYVTTNFWLQINQWNVGSTLSSVPFAGVWNGSLWSLWYEFGAYLAAGVLLTIPLVRRHRPWVLGSLLVLLMVLGAAAAGPLQIDTVLYVQTIRLGSYFLAGMLLHSLRDQIPVNRWWALASLLILVGLFWSGLADHFGPLPMAYLIFWLGATLPTRIGAVNDISYGIYIYAFPMQQFTVLLGFGHGNVVLHSIGAFLLALPLAAASWFWLEKPLLGFKDVFDKPLWNRRELVDRLGGGRQRG